MDNNLNAILLKARAEILLKINEFQEALTGIDKVLGNTINGQQNIFNNTSTETYANVKITTVSEVKQLFKDNPEKSFSPAQIGKYLDNLKLAGKISFKAEGIRAAYTVLRNLQDSGFVDKVYINDNLYYSLKKKDSD